MTKTSICWATLLIVIGFLLAAPPVLSQSNPPCAGMSATAYVNWPQAGFDPCRTGYNPNEFLLSPATVGNLTFEWKYTTSNEVEDSPAIANGIAYVGTQGNGYLYAVNAATGEFLWKFATYNAISSSPAVVNGIVYFGGGYNDFYALNATTGALVWKYSAETSNYFVTSPAVTGGVVYVASSEYDNGAGALYALNATTGGLLWKNTTPWGYPTSPAVANGIVYVGWQDYDVYSVKAFNAVTGALVWSFDTGYRGVVPNTPVVADGAVYIGSWTGNFYALDAGTGAVLWEYSIGRSEARITTSATVANGVVYVGSNWNLAGMLYAFDASTGALLWEVWGIWSTPLIANGVLYVADGNGISAFDAGTGALLWQSPMSPGFGDPVVANGVVYVGSYDHNLYAFHLPGH